MECGLSKEILSAYVDGEASPGEANRVEEHLRTCGKCAAAERRMRALGAAAARAETPVSPELRDRLFARMEREGLLRRRRGIFAFSVRWAALPLAAAAALGLVLLTSREAVRGPAGPPPRAAAERPGEAPPPGGAPAGREPAARETPVVSAEELSPEELEIVTYLEILEDPQAFDEPAEVDELEIFAPPEGRPGQG